MSPVPAMLPMFSVAVDAYHRELVARLRSIVGPPLVGVYAGGSFAFGDFDPARSDLDVVAVRRGASPLDEKRTIAAELRHEVVPCPARGLEFVLYSDEAARSPSIEPDFELNLNTGDELPFRADFEPGAERHWFAIDRAILASHGVALLGAPSRDVFVSPPRAPLLGALAKSITWFRTDEPTSPSSVLNACRTLRFVADGTWSSKGAAGAWALTQPEVDHELVARALEARDSGERLPLERVAAWLETVEWRVARAAPRG